MAPLIRKYRSSRKEPRETSEARSRFVAMTKRTSMRRGLTPPTRMTSRRLQHAKQLGLDRQGELADLIEERGASVRCFEQTGLLAQGPPECAWLVTEELALDDRGRQRGAIDWKKRAWAARSGRLMNRLWRRFSFPTPVSPRRAPSAAGCDALDHLIESSHLRVL